MLNLMWFRSDLRVYDNPALMAARNQGTTCAIYFATPEQWREHDWSEGKISLVVAQVEALSRELAKLNIPLTVLRVERFADIPERLACWVRECSVTQVFFNYEYEINESACADAVTAMLHGESVPAWGYHDQCIIPPGQIRTRTGGVFKVFTAFKKVFLEQFPTRSRGIFNRPEMQHAKPFKGNSDALSEIPVERRWRSLWPMGENEAHDRLNRFIEHKINGYRDDRDVPSLDSTSALSPYLTLGCLSTTQCMHAAMSANYGRYQDGNPGVLTWINELIWREFYRHLMFAFPDICRYRPFKPETDLLPWSRDEALFSAWKTGQTGFPIVDAAMRQLLHLGWMHNRLRMVTAMFLTKDLFIDWRWGERYFMQMLVDGDLASNNGGWQWSASTGVDAAPYFRVFNPVRQSERFDPKGVFIRRYLPELAALDDRSIHQPSAAQARACGYPLPIVDHRLAVDSVKAHFKALSLIDDDKAMPTVNALSVMG
ncbi:deoxyribodipyrimidine photo-lyase [Oleiphilus messinensis]|nr:deoxyribodipyrimidine photo-lyase [Oleiphilus messinensis]